METLSILDVLWNIFTNIDGLFFYFGEVKSIFVLIFFAEKFLMRVFNLNINFNKKINTFDPLEILNAKNQLKIYNMITNSIWYNCLQFLKNCINIYGKIHILLKNALFCTFFPLNRKSLYPNCTKLSENMTKCIEVIMLKF